MIEPRVGETGERAGVDMDVVKLIPARHEPRKHSGVGRVDFARDKGQPHALHWSHAEVAKDRDMRMPGPYENDVLHDRNHTGFELIGATSFRRLS